MLPCQEARSRRPNTSGGRETLTLLDCRYRIRIRTIFLDAHRPRFALDTITVGPGLKRSVALKDGDVSVSVQRLADDMNSPARIMPKLNELSAQRRERPLGCAAVSTGSEIDRKAAFDMTGDEGPDQFDSVHGGEDRWDQCRIPFLWGDVDGEGGDTASRPAFHAMRWRRFTSAEGLAGVMAPAQTGAHLWLVLETLPCGARA